MTVFILTYCRSPELFYGTKLVFKTLRTGFPNSRVVVVDNASVPEVRVEVESLAAENDCQFVQIPEPSVQHYEFIETTLREVASGEDGNESLVFVDPDICFWDCCEGFHFDGLMAGKLVRPFECEATQTLSMPRVHTSFLWIPSAKRLWEKIENIRADRFDFEPFQPYSTKIAGRWTRFDTGASLYAVLGQKISCFTEAHLNCYDHLFCGSHFDWIYPLLDARGREMLSTTHTSAKEGNLDALRGIWKWQDEVCRVNLGGAAARNRRGKVWKRETLSVR